MTDHWATCLEAVPPTLAETDRLLAGLAEMPCTDEVTEVVDMVLDYRLRVMGGRVAALESLIGSVLWLLSRNRRAWRCGRCGREMGGPVCVYCDV